MWNSGEPPQAIDPTTKDTRSTKAMWAGGRVPLVALVALVSLAVQSMAAARQGA